MSVYCLQCLLKAMFGIYTVLDDLQLALVEMDDVRVAVGNQTLCTPLTANTTLLVAREHAMNTVSIVSQRVAEGVTYA
jgi:hypothetical protein